MSAASISTVCIFWQNAMRATVETHEMSATLPSIKVRVSLGSEDLTIKVDEDRAEIMIKEESWKS